MVCGKLVIERLGVTGWESGEAPLRLEGGDPVAFEPLSHPSTRDTLREGALEAKGDFFDF